MEESVVLAAADKISVGHSLYSSPQTSRHPGLRAGVPLPSRGIAKNWSFTACGQGAEEAGPRIKSGETKKGLDGGTSRQDFGHFRSNEVNPKPAVLAYTLIEPNCSIAQ